MSESGPDVLRAIVGAARRITDVRRQRTPAPALEGLAERAPRSAVRFIEALRQGDGPRIIAECKRRSPSRGILRHDYDPAAIARTYVRAGAAAISVLTEPAFFDGAPEHLVQVRAAVDVPVLRKDFIVDEYQLLEARAWGADAALLIAAALSDAALEALMRSAAALSIDSLVEVHDERELERALACGARLVGVNNRNLRTLQVDPDVTLRLAERIPADVLAVAESGLRTDGDLARLGAAGYRAFLIGERLVAAADPGAALRQLVHS
jgi:indole-3-glycerol phosphate synthase